MLAGLNWCQWPGFVHTSLTIGDMRYKSSVADLLSKFSLLGSGPGFSVTGVAIICHHKPDDLGIN